MRIEIICVAYERPIALQVLINCFLLQTNPNWRLHVVYDGKAPQNIIDIVGKYIEGADERVHFYESPARYQKYGHPNRRTMLQSVEMDPKDFVLFQNDDNYMVPKTIQFILDSITYNTGIVYWNTVHSHMDYNVHISELRENFIDMAAFAVRSDIAKATGFQYDHFSADGTYAEECLRNCNTRHLKAVKINKPLLVHN